MEVTTPEMGYTNVMNEEERSRFLQALHEDAEFRAAVQRELQFDALLALPDQVARLTTTVEMLSAAVHSLIDHGAEIQQGLQALVQQQANTQSAIAALAEVTGQLLALVRDGFQEMREVLGSLRSDMDTGFHDLRSDMDAGFHDLRSDMDAGFHDLRSDMDAGFHDLRSDMDAGFAKINADLDQVKADVRNLKADVRNVKTDVGDIKRHLGPSPN